MKMCLARRCLRAVALLALVFVFARSPGATAPVDFRDHAANWNGPSIPATHLYEAQGGSVVAYPLAADGMPAKTPDWRLNGGLQDAYGIGFDGAGDLYVSD